LFNIESFTLPDYKVTPPNYSQIVLNSNIPRDVPIDLRGPKLGVCRWAFATLTIRVTVPKASMNKYDLLMPREDNIRRTWKTLSMQAESITHSMK